MRRRKLGSIRRIAEQAARGPAIVSYNPGTMTEPLPAVERAMSAFRRSIRGHPVGAYDNCRAVLGDLRIVAAEVLGGDPEGWAHADGHTATIDRIASSLAQHFGATAAHPATVVSTRSEHIGGLGAFTADPRFHVTVVEPEELGSVTAQIHFLSHLTYDTNRDLSPEITRLCAGLAGSGDHVVVIDGTQAVGQVPVDVRQLGCHAYLSSAHKWLGGPPGSGLLYLRADVMERWPTPFRAGEPLCTDLPIGRWEPRGGQDFARVAGIAAALRAYQCHARPGAALRAYVVSLLEARLGDQVRVLGSSTPQGRVVAFALRGRDVYPVYRELAARGISVKCIKRDVPCADTGTDCLEVIRLGFPWWAEEALVEHAVGTLAAVLGEAPGVTGDVLEVAANG